MPRLYRSIMKLMERPNVGAAGVLQTLPIKVISHWALSFFSHASWIFILTISLLTLLHIPYRQDLFSFRYIVTILGIYLFYIGLLEIASRRLPRVYDSDSFRLLRIAVNTLTVSALVFSSRSERNYFWIFYTFPLFQAIIYYKGIRLYLIIILQFISYFLTSLAVTSLLNKPPEVMLLGTHTLLLLLLGFSFQWLLGVARAIRSAERQELETLRQTALEITAQRDPRQLLQTIIQRSIELLKARGGGIYEFNSDLDELMVVADWGNKHSIVGHKLKLGEGMAGKVASTGQPLIVNDYAIWPGRVPHFEPDLFRAVVEVPLVSHSDILGVLYVTDDAKDREFVQRDVELLTLLASHAAIAIANAKAFEKSRSNFNELELLYRVNAKLNSALSLDDVLHVTLQEALRFAATDEGSIMILNIGTNELEIKSWMVQGKFVPPPQKRLRVGEGIAGYVAQTGRIYNCSDATQETHFFESFTNRDLRSILSIPITSRGNVLGILNADSAKPGYFKNTNVKVLRALASHVAVAIESQRLRDIGIQLSTLTLEEMYETVVENACLLTGTEASSILLWDEETGDIIRTASFPPRKKERSPRTKGGLTHRVITTGKPIIIKDVQQDPRVHRDIKESQVKSLMGAPLNVRDETSDDSNTVKTVGALFVNTTKRRSFGKRDEELLQSLANQAAVAITKAQLYKQITLEHNRSAELASQLQELYTYVKDMQSELEMPNLLNLIAQRASTLLKADAGAIFLAEENGISLRGGYGLNQGLENYNEQIDHLINNHLLAKKKPVTANNITNFSLSNLAGGEKILAYGSTPLWIDGKISGRVDVYRKVNPGTFSEDDMQLLQLIAEQAAIAIKRRREALAEYGHITKLTSSKNDADPTAKFATIAKELQDERHRRVRAERDASWKDISFSAAHALGNPIFAIETILDPLEKRLAEGRLDEAMEVAKRIRVSVEKSKKIIDQFKSLARAQDITPVPMLLNPILEDIKTISQDKGVACKINCPIGLYILGEPDRLTECFDELTSNAINWLDKKSKIIEIEVFCPAPQPLPQGLKPRLQYALIQFKDNGPGIHHGNKNKIFELFFSTRDHGTGIGLAFIQRIIEGHEGLIMENGIQGQGASFDIYLPIHPSGNA